MLLISDYFKFQKENEGGWENEVDCIEKMALLFFKATFNLHPVCLNCLKQGSFLFSRLTLILHYFPYPQYSQSQMNGSVDRRMRQIILRKCPFCLLKQHSIFILFASNEAYPYFQGLPLFFIISPNPRYSQSQINGRVDRRMRQIVLRKCPCCLLKKELVLIIFNLSLTKCLNEISLFYPGWIFLHSCKI